MPSPAKLRALWAELSAEVRHALVVSVTVAATVAAALAGLAPFLSGLNVPAGDVAIVTAIAAALTSYVAWMHAHNLSGQAEDPKAWYAPYQRRCRHHRKPKPPVPTPQPPTGGPTPAPTPTATTVAWINQAPKLSVQDAAHIVEALNLQTPQLEAAWPNVSINHILVSSVNGVPKGAEKAYFLPNADVAGALGYHDVDPQGDPYTRVFVDTVLDNGGTVLSGSLSVSVCASHEACEVAVDPSCQSTATAPDGTVWALEVGDPVENNSYDVTCADGTNVAVSDFVHPAFFGKGAGRLDETGAVTHMFSLAPGGYAIENGQQVFGANYPAFKLPSKQFPAARTYRRLHQ